MMGSMMRRGAITTGCAATSEPDVVTGLTATPSGSTTINLTWDADSTASPNEPSEYDIERSNDGSTGWSVIATISAPAVSYSDTSLSPSTQRWYRIVAKNCFDVANASSTANATTAAPSVSPPTAPTGLTATAASSTQIDLSWTDTANNEDGFKVERSTDNTNWTEIAGAVAANSTSYSATGLTASTLYYFRVRAYNAGGNSAYTSSASATTQSGSSTYNVEYLVVAGGGGSIRGGGGAGGYRTATGFTLTPGTSYTITVGAGGSGAQSKHPVGTSTNGSNSVFSTITSTGGGAGSAYGAGSAGGSGGGAGNGASISAGGSGTSGEGNAGGETNNTASPYASAGGGGADAAGQNQQSSTVAGAGGAGKTFYSTVYAGGGGGSVAAGGTGGAGGSGGGGAGDGSGTGSGASGTVNRGGGGGGGGGGGTAPTGGNGGSGLVILRVPAANYSGTTTGSPTVTDDGSTKVLTFTASGSYTG